MNATCVFAAPARPTTACFTPRGTSFPVDQLPLGQPQQERGIFLQNEVWLRSTLRPFFHEPEATVKPHASFLGAHRRHAFVIPHECRQFENLEMMLDSNNVEASALIGHLPPADSRIA